MLDSISGTAMLFFSSQSFGSPSNRSLTQHFLDLKGQWPRPGYYFSVFLSVVFLSLNVAVCYFNKCCGQLLTLCCD